MLVKFRLISLIFLTSLIGTTSLFTSSNADAAAIAFARTTIDWDSFLIETSSTFNVNSLQSSSAAEATFATSLFSSTLPLTPIPDTINSWGNTSQSFTNGSVGSGSTTSTTLSATGNANASAPDTYQKAGAQVVREGILILNEDAFVRISFNYSLEIMLSVDGKGSRALGISSFITGLIGLTSNEVRLKGTTESKTVVRSGSFNQALSDTFTISGNFLAGEQIAIVVDAIAVAEAVQLPEPAPFWMLLFTIALVMASKRSFI